MLPAEVMLWQSLAATAAHLPAPSRSAGRRRTLLRRGAAPAQAGAEQSSPAGRGCCRGWVKPMEGDWARSPCENEFLTQFKPNGWDWA